MAAVDQPLATVLVVEDDPTIAQLLVVMLRDDFRLVMAETGREAIELARSERPSAITLDLMLPDLHGRDVLAALQADPGTAEIPVIVVSAYTRSLRDVDESQVVQVVSKPFSPLELLEAVRNAATRTV
jgi:putative two-component system response regulator